VFADVGLYCRVCGTPSPIQAQCTTKLTVQRRECSNGDGGSPPGHGGSTGTAVVQSHSGIAASGPPTLNGTTSVTVHSYSGRAASRPTALDGTVAATVHSLNGRTTKTAVGNRDETIVNVGWK